MATAYMSKDGLYHVQAYGLESIASYTSIADAAAHAESINRQTRQLADPVSGNPSHGWHSIRAHGAGEGVR